MARKQIEQINTDVVAGLSVEELEERLETQVLRIPEASCSWSCDNVCENGYACMNVGAHCQSGFVCGEYCS
jgi:hypothetical protein